MRSLYLGYPVGGLLTWETQADSAAVRGDAAGRQGLRVLILDGQQRITSLYGVSRGRPPAFFQGDAKAFTGLRFNVEDENFEFYAPTKMRDDPRWIDVTALFVEGLEPHIAVLSKHPETQHRFAAYMERLVRLRALLDREFHEDKITGLDKTVDVVVDIFNRVNSGGTKLSKGDLALAKKCAHWPEARAVMRSHLQRWEKDGFYFSLDWLLRNATAVATGRAEFASLDNVQVPEFRASLEASTRYVGYFLDVVAGRLGLDHDRVLMGRYAFPVVSRLLHESGGRFTDAGQVDRVLFWYIQSALWGRFAGSTETVLNQDYEAASRSVNGLISSLERWRGGNLTIGGYDFEGFGQGSRFYPLLYMLTRVCQARDFGSGLPLRSHMLGHLAALQVHHVFPKAVLYSAGYSRSQVNAVANFCFLTQNTNIAIGKRQPADYFEEAERKHPGVLASQWIPEDKTLWQVDHYPDFLAARRELLAAAANEFLAELRSGKSAGQAAVLDRLPIIAEAPDEADERSVEVAALVAELVELGCTEAVVDSEISDPADGHALGIADACWPEGLQPGQGQPVVLMFDPKESNRARLQELGYEVFTSTESLKGKVLRQNQEAAGRSDEISTPAETQSSMVDAQESPMDLDVRSDFERAMKDVYVRAKKEANYTAGFFISMLTTYGGLETAKRLLASQEMHSGFTALYERGRLDLTVEALVVQRKYSELFTDEEMDTAHRRLRQLGYDWPDSSQDGPRGGGAR